MGWVECLAVKRHLLLVEFFLSKLHLFQRLPHQIWLLLFPILFVWTDYYLSGLFTQMNKSAEIVLLTCLVQTTPSPSSLSCAGHTTAANRGAAPEDREYCSAAEVQLPLFSSTTVKTFKKSNSRGTVCAYWEVASMISRFNSSHCGYVFQVFQAATETHTKI